MEMKMFLINFIKRKGVVGCLILGVTLSGLTNCMRFPHQTVVAPMASVSEDLEAKAFHAISDKAILYVYRDEFFAQEQFMDIVVGGVAIARSVVESYVRLELHPGTHEIISKSERDAKFIIEAKAGQLYFMHQEGTPGIWKARSRLVLVSDQIGRQGVQRCKLLRTAVPANE
jgi:hypothetical protein